MNLGRVHKITNNCLPIISVGMYESNLSPEYVFGEDLDFEKFDYDKYKNKVGALASELLRDVSLEDWGVKIKSNGHIWSPKYYNYNTDELFIDIELNDDFLSLVLEKRDILENDKNVLNYINARWRSYDGYISFMPESIEELFDEITSEKSGYDTSLLVGGLVSLIAVHEGYIYFDDDGYVLNSLTEELIYLLYDCSSECFYTE